MFNKYLSVFLLFALVQTTFTQSVSWEAVKNSTGLEIAFKKTNGQTIFGRLSSADDNEISVQVATKKDFSGTSQTFPRGEIERLWLADLRFGERNTAKGAVIGLGIGAGAGFGYLMANRKSGDGQAALAVPMFAIYGAGIGALIGFFAKKGHKKGKLIYKN